MAVTNTGSQLLRRWDTDCIPCESEAGNMQIHQHRLASLVTQRQNRSGWLCRSDGHMLFSYKIVRGRYHCCFAVAYVLNLFMSVCKIRSTSGVIACNKQTQPSQTFIIGMQAVSRTW